MRTYRQVKVHKFVIKTAIPPIFIQDVSHMYINTSYKYHRVTCTQSCVIRKVHDLLGQPSYVIQKIVKYKYFSFQGLRMILQQFSRQIIFSRTFQESASYSSTYQACAMVDY